MMRGKRRHRDPEKTCSKWATKKIMSAEKALTQHEGLKLRSQRRSGVASQGPTIRCGNRSTERSSLFASGKASLTEISVSGCSTGSIGGQSSTESRARRERQRR